MVKKFGNTMIASSNRQKGTHYFNIGINQVLRARNSLVTCILIFCPLSTYSFILSRRNAFTDTHKRLSNNMMYKSCRWNSSLLPPFRETFLQCEQTLMFHINNMTGVWIGKCIVVVTLWWNAHTEGIQNDPSNRAIYSKWVLSNKS